MASTARARLPAADGEGASRRMQRAQTRDRIREAAKALFHATSVAATTIDQIAAAAGVSRPTFYVHFRDKDEVIRDIVQAYAQAAKTVNELLAGPEPTAAEIRAWLDRKVEFYHAEQVSLALLYQAGHNDPKGAPPVVQDLMAEVLAGFAARLPAFRVALAPGDHQPHARVRAEMLVRQVTVACEFCAREGPTPSHRAALDITAESFARLLGHFADIAARLPPEGEP